MRNVSLVPCWNWPLMTTFASQAPHTSSSATAVAGRHKTSAGTPAARRLKMERIRGLLCSRGDEIYYWFRIFRRGWKVPLSLPDDDRDLSAEFLITFLDDASLALQPGVQGAAVVQDRHACLRQRRKIVNRLRFARHQTAHERIPGINAGDLARVGDRPGVGFARLRPGPFQYRIARESIIHKEFVSIVPPLLLRTPSSEPGDHNVEALRQQRLLDGRIPLDRIPREHPGFSLRHGLGHNDRYAVRPEGARIVGVVAVVTLREPWPPGRGIGGLFL